jgi:hypothetical protein
VPEIVVLEACKVAVDVDGLVMVADGLVGYYYCTAVIVIIRCRAADVGTADPQYSAVGAIEEGKRRVSSHRKYSVYRGKLRYRTALMVAALFFVIL